MKQWEYLSIGHGTIEVLGSKVRTLEITQMLSHLQGASEMIAELGLRGWELCSVSDNTIWFKRELL